VSAVAAVGLAAAMAGQSPPAQDLPSLQEGLSVREVELVLEPPVGKGFRDLRASDLKPPNTSAPGDVRVAVPQRKGLGDLRPADILVLEDGRSRPVLRLEPVAASAEHPWTLRIYFDLVLALPDTVFRAAIALAYEADQLAHLGTVEIVVADPEPRTTLPPSREVPAIKEALASLAAESRRDSRAGPFSPVPPPALAAVRRQCDRLVTSLAAAAATGPHALLLVTEPPRLSPGELQLLASVSKAGAGSAGTDQGAVPSAVPGDAPDGHPALVLGDAARLLAAYGWVTMALPIHRLQGSREPVPEDEIARFRRQNWQDPHAPGGVSLLGLIIALVQVLRGKPLHAPDMRLVAAQVGMEDLSLVELVRPTAGLVVPYREELAPALGALAARWHLWYQADSSPAGCEQPVAVSLLANAQDLRTPRWVHSSIPESLAAARLRRSLDGDSLPGPLGVSATVVEAPAGSATPGALVALAQTQPFTVGASSTSGPLRVSFAWTDARGGVTVTHRLLDAGATALWNQRRSLLLAPPRPPAAGQVMAVLIENLASELWGCAVVGSPAGAAVHAALGRAVGGPPRSRG